MLDSAIPPKPFESVLAEISYPNDLSGKGSFFEVVFHDGKKWRHYIGSHTFSFKSVERWIYAREAFNIAKVVNK